MRHFLCTGLRIKKLRLPINIKRRSITPRFHSCREPLLNTSSTQIHVTCVIPYPATELFLLPFTEPTPGCTSQTLFPKLLSADGSFSLLDSQSATLSVLCLFHVFHVRYIICEIREFVNQILTGQHLQRFPPKSF